MNKCDWEETQNVAIARLESELDDPAVKWGMTRNLIGVPVGEWASLPRSVLWSSTGFFVAEVDSTSQGDKPFAQATLRSSILNYAFDQRISDAYKKGVNMVRCKALLDQLAYVPPEPEKPTRNDELKELERLLEEKDRRYPASLWSGFWA